MTELVMWIGCVFVATITAYGLSLMGFEAFRQLQQYALRRRAWKRLYFLSFS